MKTLDEVIKALRCADPEVDPETKCKDCPYKESHIDELWYVGPSCLDEMFADALHYLKEYQTILPLVPSLINTAIAVQKKGKTIG